jgi:hypothetical protein
MVFSTYAIMQASYVLAAACRKEGIAAGKVLTARGTSFYVLLLRERKQPKSL